MGAPGRRGRRLDVRWGVRLRAGLAIAASALAFACAPTPLRPQPPSPIPEPVPQVERRPERGTTWELPADALFAEGTPELTADGRERVRAVAREVASAGVGRVVVRGYSDDEGSQAFQIELSEQRAMAVRELCIAEGIEPERVRAHGLGPRFPVASNASEDGRRRNRRITIEVRPVSTSTGGVQ